MNGHVTQSRLDRVINLHGTLPQTDLRRGDSLVISSIKLDLGHTLSVGWLSLQLLRINIAEVLPTRIINSLGFVYAGIFAGGFDTLRRPTGMPISFVNLSGPNVKVLNPYIVREFSGPDIVEIVVVNNTTDTDVEVMVAGSMKLFINT